MHLQQLVYTIENIFNQNKNFEPYVILATTIANEIAEKEQFSIESKIYDAGKHCMLKHVCIY